MRSGNGEEHCIRSKSYPIDLEVKYGMVKEGKSPALRSAQIKIRLYKVVVLGGAIVIMASLVNSWVYNDMVHRCFSGACSSGDFSSIQEQLDLSRTVLPFFIILGSAIILMGIILAIKTDYIIRALSPINPLKIGEDWDAKGLAAWRSGDLNGAETALRKAIEMQPSFVQGLFDLSTLLIAMDRKGEAVETLKKLLEFEPDAPNVWFHLGNIYISLEEWTDAAQAFQNVVNADPSDAKVWYSLGNAREQVGDVDGAIFAYREGLLQEPEKDVKDRITIALRKLENAP
jgi:tetratricopeptide (TPR) repeat protein